MEILKSPWVEFTVLHICTFTFSLATQLSSPAVHFCTHTHMYCTCTFNLASQLTCCPLLYSHSHMYMHLQPRYPAHLLFITVLIYVLAPSALLPSSVAVQYCTHICTCTFSLMYYPVLLTCCILLYSHIYTFSLATQLTCCTSLYSHMCLRLNPLITCSSVLLKNGRSDSPKKS